MSSTLPSADEAARELADGLEGRGIEYAIGGALALGQCGVVRGTTDVDMNLWMDPSKPTAVAHLLGELGCLFKASSIIRGFQERGFAYAALRGVRVDVYLPTRDFHASVLARRQRRPLQGREAWLLSAEDLAVFKMILYRAKDRADVEALLVVQARALDRAYVRGWIARLRGACDVRLKTWDDLVGSAEAAQRLRESGWKPPQEREEEPPPRAPDRP